MNYNISKFSAQECLNRGPKVSYSVLPHFSSATLWQSVRVRVNLFSLFVRMSVCLSSPPS